MPIKVSNSAELVLLAAIRSYLNSQPDVLHLYQNDLTPGDSDEVGDYTECDFDGYLSINLGAWSVPTTVSGKAYIAEATKVFVCTGNTTPNDVYGYYVTNYAGTELLWAQRFTSPPIPITEADDAISVTPTFTLSTAS
jgi:hypothetical protein